MHPRARRLIASVALSVTWLAGCAVLEHGDPDATGGDAADASGDAVSSGLTCTGCHTSEELLRQSLPAPETPATAIEGTGDG